jgi:hypothetical protein
MLEDKQREQTTRTAYRGCLNVYAIQTWPAYRGGHKRGVASDGAEPNSPEAGRPVSPTVCACALAAAGGVQCALCSLEVGPLAGHLYHHGTHSFRPLHNHQ